MASSLMKWNLWLCLCLGLINCAVDPDAGVCDESLFGTPSVNTGLDEGQCASSCGCGESSWLPPLYTDEDITRLEQLILMDAPALLKEDPYLAASPLLPSDSHYCAVVTGEEPDHYGLATYPTEQEAELDNARITHRGACGQCSSLANLAVYMRQPDLTEPVRDCGVQGMFGGEEANIDCLMDIGFDRPCAQIWYFNTRHTSEVCLDVCIALLEAPNHNEDGSLNDCIQCDEDESGAVFKAFAGRTRRNSGLPSALCRPCDSVYRVEHGGW